jgi:hypothetical protein
MAEYTNIPDSSLEPGKPIRSVDIIALRDNIEHYAENNGTSTVFTSPGTWTKPATVKRIKVTVVGGGGVARLNAPASPTFGSAGTSSFGAFASATGGSNVTGVNAAGGTGSSGDINIAGGRGGGMTVTPESIGIGGNTLLGNTSVANGSTPQAGLLYGGGGSFGGGGGGGGGTAIRWISASSIPGPVSVTIGSGGTTGGPGPTSTQRSGNGAAGVVIVEEFY